jgi:2-amino-4-hydroxy-6-hydroxymethyldihydropteridine diphosphokinase
LKGNVPIDIDIVLWNGDIIKENDFKQSYFQIGWNEIKEL